MENGILINFKFSFKSKKNCKLLQHLVTGVHYYLYYYSMCVPLKSVLIVLSTTLEIDFKCGHISIIV